MKIAIDARFFNESGVGRYVRNLIYNLSRIDKKNKYFILLLKKDFEQFKETENLTKVLADFHWYGFAEQFKLPKLLKELNPDLVHFPHFNVPIFYTGKFVVTIHDLIHQHRHSSRATRLDPFSSKLKQIGYRKVFQAAALKSQKILVPSKSVKDVLLEEWKVKPEKITITHEGVDDNILKILNNITKKDCDKVLEKFHIKKPFIFYVGNAHPHKNVEGLIKAFKILKKKHSELSLVLSGYDHFFWQRVKTENPDEGISYTGFITDEELAALYKKAEAFVLPSFEEGFGIPVLEAMASGCPVAASNVGSLTEVGSEAAVYFDPAKPDEMAEKINQVLSDKKLRESLIEKGLKRYKLFSWKKMAEQTLEVYGKCG